MRSALFAVAAAAILLPAGALAEPPATAGPACMRDGAPVPEADMALARKVITTTKAADRMTKMFDILLPTMMQMVHKSVPDMPADVAADLNVELRKEMVSQVPQLLSMVGCIYARHFTHEDMEQLLAFYGSPIGRKMLEQTPAILQESIAIGQSWGENAGRTAMEHVIARHSKKVNKT